MTLRDQLSRFHGAITGAAPLDSARDLVERGPLPDTDELARLHVYEYAYTARIAGALSGAGLFAMLGMGPAYVAIVCLYLLATALTLCVTVPKKPRRRGAWAARAEALAWGLGQGPVQGLGPQPARQAAG